MKILAKLDEVLFPKKLSFVIFDAPHRRMHVKVIQEYRNALFNACCNTGIPVPFEEPIDLEVTFIDPSSPDLGNLYLALEQAMDGSTLKGPGIVMDDGLISKVTMMKLFINHRK